MTLQLNPAPTANITVTPLYGPGIGPSIVLVSQDAGGAIAARAAANAAKLSADAAAASEAAADADRIQTGLDRVQTGQDRAQASLDASATAQDRVQTGQDRAATAADRAQTGQDRSAASAAAAVATTQAGIATSQAQAAHVSEGDAADSADTASAAASVAVTQAGIATTKASEASGSAASALSSKNTATSQAETATTKASEAAASAVAALASQTSASSAAQTATTKAAEASSSAQIATTQAGVSTTKAEEAAASAQAATTQAGIATTKASEASGSAQTAATQAGTATTKASEAAASAQTATTKASEASASALAASSSASGAAGSAATAQAVLADPNLSLAAAGLAALSVSGEIQAVAANMAAVQGASENANTAATQAGNAIAAAQSAQTSANNAVAVVTGGTASLNSSAGKIPIADATGKIDSAWVDLAPAVSAGLHRSPNAITALFIYDTSRDSDGGAWTEKCQHTSWHRETLSGKWLGAHPSELSARCHNAVLGTEVVANGSFTTDLTSWTASAGASVVSGALNLVTSSSTDVTCKQTLTTVASTSYVLTFTKVSAPGNSTDLSIIVGTSDGGTQLLNLADIGAFAAGTYIYAFTATTTTSFLRFTNSTNTAATAIVDSVSVKPVTSQVSVTGDYYQLTTDGRFYSLNAGSGAAEVFRGNKRSFPKLAAVVAEAANITIYDLTEPSRPMWMRFIATAPATIASKYLLSGANALDAINGSIYAGGTATNATGLTTIDFAKDRAQMRLASGYTWSGNLSTRNTVGGYTTVDASVGAIVNATANAVAATVLPDAPVDPVTGLKVPTIAVATGSGVSVIKHNGTVVNSSNTAAANTVLLTPTLLEWGMTSAASNWLFAKNPGALGASFAGTASAWSKTSADATNTYYTQLLGRSSRARARVSKTITYAYLNWTIHNPDAPTKPLTCATSDTHATGWLTGDIRRAYLCGIAPGALTGAERVVNGGFDSSSNWTAGTGWVISGGVASYNNTAGYNALSQNIGAIQNRTYKITFDLTVTSGTLLFVRLGSAASSVASSFTTSGTKTIYATANGTDGTLSFTNNLGAFVGTIDNVSVKEALLDRCYKAASADLTGTLTATAVNTNTDLVAYSGFSAANYIREPYSADLDFGTGEWTVSAWVSIPTGNAAAGTIVCREHSSGAYIRLGISAGNNFTATVFDGTTTRTVTTATAYNTATRLKARANYTTDGRLVILVNGVEVAAATGAPLLTLNNSNAVLTIGNSYALDAPFPGSIALLKFSASVPTAEQALFMYEQEKQMFSAGAKCLLPASTAVLDLAYDDETDTWSTLQATHESTFSGLVRTATQTPPAGSFSKASAGGGNRLLARTTTNPGVDVQLPSRVLRAELRRRREVAPQDIVVLDYFGGFTATTTLNSTSLTSIAASLYPSSTNLVGCAVSGTGIPSGTVITGISGTTIYISKAATANGSNIQISTTDFNLPVGYTARAVLTAGALKREGATADYTRLYDGFKETIRFAVAPGYNAWVQIQAVKEVI